MAYYFRAFCTSGAPPALADLLGWVGERGVTLDIDAPARETGGGTVEWGALPIPLSYQQGRLPVYLELNLLEGSDSLAGQERDEFLGMVAALKKSRKRDRVIEQLRQTTFIIACRIPIDDLNDAGFHAVDVLLAYFVVHHDGMVQADGQGFYDMGKIILELE